MKATILLARHLQVQVLLMISLLVSVGCAIPPKQEPTTVGPLCSITWDKMSDPKVTWYQITVIDQSMQAKKTVRFIPADTTKVSCRDAGADHEGLWDVTVQSCYDKSTCGSPTDVARIHITAK
jgi:hypothetical protein